MHSENGVIMISHHYKLKEEHMSHLYPKHKSLDQLLTNKDRHIQRAGLLRCQFVCSSFAGDLLRVSEQMAAGANMEMS